MQIEDVSSDYRTWSLMSPSASVLEKIVESNQPSDENSSSVLSILDPRMAKLGARVVLNSSSIRTLSVNLVGKTCEIHS